MSKAFAFTSLIPVAAMVLAMTPSALAANSRSWVSNTGSDLNPCTIDKPCATFQHAHDVTAAGGEVDVLTPGEYGGAVVNRSITFDGANMAYLFVNDTQVGFTVMAPVDAVVVIRNMSFKSLPGVTTGVGIFYSTAASVLAENLSMTGMGMGIQMGLSKATVRAQLMVKDTVIRGATNAGVVLQGVTAESGIANAILDHVTIEQTKQGLYALNAKAEISHSTFSYCGDSAIFAYNYSKINIADSTIAFSNNGVNALGNNVVRLSSNNIHDNSFALTGVGTIESFGNNRLRGNSSAETPSATVPLK